MNRNPYQGGLKPFKPGQSGNPSGRPKSNLNHLLSEYSFKKDRRTDKTYGELLVKKIFALALIHDDMDAIKYIWDRLEGVMKQDNGQGVGASSQDIVAVLAEAIEQARSTGIIPHQPPATQNGDIIPIDGNLAQ